jgi:hypothetical protein
LRNLFGLAALIVALAVPSVAVAASLSNAKGTSCDGIAVWHFVNNQTGGADPGSLTASFSGGLTVTTDPSAVNKNTQHFIVETTGDVTLLDAETDLPGRLVLSDVSCDEGKKGKK